MIDFGRTVFDSIRRQQIEGDYYRRARMLRALDAYNGNYPQPMKVAQGRPDDNLTINYARLLVDTGAAFFLGKDLYFDVNMREINNEEEVFLQKTWRSNGMQSTLYNIATSGGIFGHVFVRLYAAPEGRRYPRISLIDPLDITVKWSPLDIRDVLWYEVTSMTLDEREAPVILKERYEPDKVAGKTVRWNITQSEGRNRFGFNERSAAMRVVDGVKFADRGEYQWDYPFCPIFECQNRPVPNEFWGGSDLEDDILRIIEAINLVVSTTRKVHRNSGFPQTVGTGFNPKSLEKDPEGTIILPSPEANLFYLSSPGSTADGQEMLKMLKEQLHLLSRVPELALGDAKAAGGFPSGIALNMAFQPLITLSELKRALYGDMIERLNAAILILGGFREGEDIEEISVTNVWSDLLPRDTTVDYQLKQMAIGMGVVSKQTVSRQLGFDAEAEMARIADEMVQAAKVQQSILGDALGGAPKEAEVEEPDDEEEPAV